MHADQLSIHQFDVQNPIMIHHALQHPWSKLRAHEPASSS